MTQIMLASDVFMLGDYVNDPYGLVLGILVLLYIVAAIVQKVRVPNTGKRVANVKVESIEKLRVPIDVQTRGRQLTNHTVMPVSKYQINFRDCDTNEMYSFAVATKYGEEFRENQLGKLTYNGANFLKFERV